MAKENIKTGLSLKLENILFNSITLREVVKKSCFAYIKHH